MPYTPFRIAVVALALSVYLGGWPKPAESVEIDIDSLYQDSVKVKVDTTRPPMAIPPTQIISETAIPPATARFHFDRDCVFSYTSTPDSAAFNPNRPGAEALQPLSGGFPLTQRIVCLPTMPDGDTTIIKLSSNARYGNLRARIAPREIAAFVRAMSVAYVDVADGRIIREIAQRSNNPDRVDTLEQKYADFTATLWDFYGPWMLYLSDDFVYERHEQPPFAGITRVLLAVEGRDSVDGRECFVVRLTRGAPNRPGRIKTYWVDVDERVTVKATDDFFTLKLFAPPNDSTGARLDGDSTRSNREP